MESLLERMGWLVQLRWLAVGGVLVTVVCAAVLRVVDAMWRSRDGSVWGILGVALDFVASRQEPKLPWLPGRDSGVGRRFLLLTLRQQADILSQHG